MCEIYKTKININDIGENLLILSDLDVYLQDSQNNLCPSHYNSYIICFWSGSVNVTLLINGNKIKLTSYDSDYKKINIGDHVYYFKGINVVVKDMSKDKTYLIVEIKKCHV